MMKIEGSKVKKWTKITIFMIYRRSRAGQAQWRHYDVTMTSLHPDVVEVQIGTNVFFCQVCHF